MQTAANRMTAVSVYGDFDWVRDQSKEFSQEKFEFKSFGTYGSWAAQQEIEEVFTIVINSVKEKPLSYGNLANTIQTKLVASLSYNWFVFVGDSFAGSVNEKGVNISFGTFKVTVFYV